MTTKKALQIIDYVLERKTQVKSCFLNPEMSWNKGSDIVSDFSKQLAEILEDDVKILCFLRDEIQPKCSHPLKLRDRDPEGNWYCMDCNMDL